MTLYTKRRGGIVMIHRDAANSTLTANAEYTGTIPEMYRPITDISTVATIATSGTTALISVTSAGTFYLRPYQDITTGINVKILLTYVGN